MIKRIIAILCVVLITIPMTVSCSDNNSSNSSDKISVVCTVFPEYDWIKNIIGDSDKFDVTLLYDSGADLHNFQPTTDDIVKILNCDLFVYVGGESDAWVDDTLSTAKNGNMKVIDLMEVLGDKAKEEIVKEGMQAEAEEEESSEHRETEVENDEHVWLSLGNAKLFCSELERVFCEIDSENAEYYRLNNAAYAEKLDKLDADYKNAVSKKKYDTLVFADRFPFLYLLSDYGIDYYAAFVGCSAETEASFETIAFLANKVDELGQKAVMVIEGSDQKIAKTVIENTKSKDMKIVEMDSMQSVTTEKINAGETYLGAMEKNLTALKKGLGIGE